MMSIDKFIQQLIHSGLAGPFLNAIKDHYLKIVEIYNMISFINEDDIEDINGYIDDDNNAVSVTITAKQKFESEITPYDSDDFIIQVDNSGNTVTITVSNNHGNEEDIYETRFNGCKKTNSNKWS